MTNLLKAEYFYLFKNKKYYVFLGVVLLLFGICFFVKYSFLPAVVQLLTIVFCALIIFDFTKKDFENNTLKNFVGTGISHKKVYYSKLIVCMTGVVILLATSIILFNFTLVACGTRQFEELVPSAFCAQFFSLLIQSVIMFFILSYIKHISISILVAIVYSCLGPILLAATNNSVVNYVLKFTSYSISQNVNSLISMAGSSLPLDFICLSVLQIATPFVIAIALTLLGAYLYSKRSA